MPQGWNFGAPRGSKIILFQTWSIGISNHESQLAYQIDGDDEQNRMQEKIWLYGQTGDLGVRSKGQILLNFDYHVNSKIFVPNFEYVLTNKR